jgi:hypothetical protein
MSLIIIYELVARHVFSESPSFVRQIITDPSDDWFVLKPRENFTTVNTIDGGSSNVTIGKTTTECTSEKYRFPDISAVSYFSDGKTLNATLWLYYPFIEPAKNATAWLSPPIKDVPWYRIVYAMSIGIHSVYDIEGSDYQIKELWYIYDNRWSKIVEEMSSTNETKIVDQRQIYTHFSEREKRHIDISMDLGTATSPNRYSVLFYTMYVFIKDGHLCGISDISNRVYIPPSEFQISTSPQDVILRPGEEKIVELQIKSNTNIKSQAFLSTNQTDEIELNFSPNVISIPSNGLATSRLHLKVSENVNASDYTLPIFANMSIPTESKIRGSNVSTDIMKNSISANITEYSNLTFTILPPYTLGEQLNNFTNTYIAPISGIWTFLAGVAAVIAPLIIRLYSKKQNKNKKLSDWLNPRK